MTAATQAQLRAFLQHLVEWVSVEREHVPAITNADVMPFPVDVSSVACAGVANSSTVWPADPHSASEKSVTNKLDRITAGESWIPCML